MQTASDIFAQELILHPKSASEQIEQLGIGLRVIFGGKRRFAFKMTATNVFSIPIVLGFEDRS